MPLAFFREVLIFAVIQECETLQILNSCKHFISGSVQTL